MSPSQKRDRLQKFLNHILWFVPALMSSIGIGYAFIEHRRHVNDPSWPWLTFLAVFILGFIGPALSWLALRWAVKLTEDYLLSQQELADRAEELITLNKLITASRTLNLKDTLNTILDKTILALDASAGMLFIKKPGDNHLTLETHRGISDEMVSKEATLRPGHCLCGQSVTLQKVLFAPKIEDDSRCTSDHCICEGFKSVACAPLDVNGQLVGLIQLASEKTHHFSKKQYDFLNAAAAQVSVSIENARLYNEVQSFNNKLEQKIAYRTEELESARRELAHKANQLQNLLDMSYRVREETQERIAHDIHDGVTQTVIGALFEIQAAQDSLNGQADKVSEHISRAQNLLANVDHEIRRVIYDLHPPVLDRKGLVLATKRFTASCSETFNINCQVDVEGNPKRFPKHAEITIYRIIQSALQNVAAHSQANQALVEFSFNPDHFYLKISDDGIGFHPDRILEDPGHHMGLIGMKERAESLGATLALDSNPGQGTRIQFHLPTPHYQAIAQRA